MKHLMIAFALALSLVTLPARAEDKVTIADCGDSGCACYLSNYSANEIAVVLGVDPPAGEGTATLVHAGGDYFWTRAPLAEIDLAYGGKGECPLALFDQEIQPEDGTWTLRTTGQAFSGCPKDLEPMLQGMAAMSSTRRIAWEGKFHPDRLRMGEGKAAIAWSPVTALDWSGVGPSAGVNPARITTDYRATLVRPDLVQGFLLLLIRATADTPEARAILDAVGMANCRALVRYEVRRSGP